MSGTLYLVSTPIGNLGDITIRAIETLRMVDVVLCEDTRRTRNLMAHLGLEKNLLRYDDHIHHEASQEILSALKEGKKMALVTDAGTPTLSDPGARLVKEAVAIGIKTVPIPGPCAAVAALTVSGFLSEGALFLGFLPRRPGRAERALREALGLGKTIVVYESPFRAEGTLRVISALAPERDVVVARELTKMHEEFLRGPVEQVCEQMKTRPQKGEVTIVIGPSPN